MENKFYKVVSIVENRKYSFWATEELKKEYSTEFETETDSDLWELGFGLFLFNDLQAAKANSCSPDNEEIWEVAAEDIKPAPKWVGHGEFKTEIFDNNLGFSLSGSVGGYDRNVVVARKVKLINLVNNER